jgi:hypothetical protein
MQLAIALSAKHTLFPELERAAKNPSSGESEEEVDPVAVEILKALGAGEPEA